MSVPKRLDRLLSIPGGAHLTLPSNPLAIASEEHTLLVASWGLDRIDQRNQTYGGGELRLPNWGEDARIFIVDSGVESPELAGRIVRDERLRIRTCGTAVRCTDHGTHVAALAAGSVHGVAREAQVVAVDVLGSDNSACATDLVRGLRAVSAFAHAGDIANLSLEFRATCSDPTDDFCAILDREVARLADSGILVVVAAGNEGKDASNHPLSRSPDALVVGGMTKYDQPNYRGGPSVDLIAPAEDVETGGPDGEDVYGSGTSLAAPLVAGFAAIAVTSNPELAGRTLANAITAWATPIPTAHPGKTLCSKIGGDCPPTTP